MHNSRLQRAAARAWDLSHRSVRRGRDSQRRRVHRWWQRLFMICQCAITAGLSWEAARWLLNDPTPVFAPVAAMITLGFSFGQRLGRAVEIAVGVSVGVLFGDVFLYLFGTGMWQLIVVCVLSMSVATWLGARNLMITQAGVQAVMVMTMVQGVDQGIVRWASAMIGCLLALVVATIAPSGPVTRPRWLASHVLAEVADTLDELHDALVTGDAAAGRRVLERARRSETDLEALASAISEGMAVVRYSPFQRGLRHDMQDLSALAIPLDRLTRNLRVLARRSSVALYRGESIPQSYCELLGEVSRLVRWCAHELSERRVPTGVVDMVKPVAERSSHLELAKDLSSVVVLAQLRSMLIDLLDLGGMAHLEALDVIPAMD